MLKKIEVVKTFLSWKNLNLGEKILLSYNFLFFIGIIGMQKNVVDFFWDIYIILAAPMLLFYFMHMIFIIFYTIYYIYAYMLACFVIFELIFIKGKDKKSQYIRLLFSIIFQISIWCLYLFLDKNHFYSLDHFFPIFAISLFILVTNPFTSHRFIHSKKGNL